MGFGRQNGPERLAGNAWMGGGEAWGIRDVSKGFWRDVRGIRSFFGWGGRVLMYMFLVGGFGDGFQAAWVKLKKGKGGAGRASWQVCGACCFVPWHDARHRPPELWHG